MPNTQKLDNNVDFSTQNQNVFEFFDKYCCKDEIK
jgi:hypothetical protein